MRLAFQNPRITATRGSICARKMPAFASHFLSLFSCCFAPFTPHTNTHSSALWHASRTQPSPLLCFSALASYLAAFLQANGTHVGCAHAFAATKFCIGWVICRVLDMRPQRRAGWPLSMLQAPPSGLRRLTALRMHFCNSYAVSQQHKMPLTKRTQNKPLKGRQLTAVPRQNANKWMGRKPLATPSGAAKTAATPNPSSSKASKASRGGQHPEEARRAKLSGRRHVPRCQQARRPRFWHGGHSDRGLVPRRRSQV